MTTIRVDVSSSTPSLNRVAKKLQEMQLTHSLAKSFATELKIAVRENADINRPQVGLAAKIKAVKRTKNLSYIEAPYYFWFADQGRNPGEAPEPSLKLEQWASKSNHFQTFNGAYRLGRSIAEKGTKGRYFYKKAKLRWYSKSKEEINEQFK